MLKLDRALTERSCGTARRLACAITLFLAILIPAGLAAATTAVPAAILIQPTGPAAEVSVDDVQSLRRRMEERTDLTDSVKQEVVKSCDAALESLRDAATQTERIQELERDRLSAPSELEVAKSDAAQQVDAKVELPPDATLDQIRQLRDQAEANLTLAQAKVKELDDEQARRIKRRTDEIPAQTAKATQESEEVSKALQALENQSPNSESAEVIAARRMELMARLQKLRNQIAALGKELANYEARTELLQLQRDKTLRRVTNNEKAARDWRELAGQREKLEATEKAAAARLAAAQAHPAVKDLAKKNVSLLEHLSGNPGTGAATGLFTRRAAAERKLDELDKQSLLLKDRLAREQRAGASAGLNEVVDMRLRRIRSDLPNLKVHRAALLDRRTELADLQQQLADLEYERDSQPDVQIRKQAILDLLDPAISADVREEIARQIDELLLKQQEIYNSLAKEYNDYAEFLQKVQHQELELITVGQQFASFIDERILWIRSMPPVRESDFSQAIAALKTLLSVDAWTTLFHSLWTDARSNPKVSGTWIGLFLVLFVVKRWLSGKLRVIAQMVPQVYSDRFTHTINALLITILLSIFWPAVLWFIAWRLNNALGITDFNKAVASGLNRAGVILLTLQFHRQLFKPNGLGEAHFSWRPTTVMLLRKHLLWLVVITGPLAFIIDTAEALNDPGAASLGRLAFVLGMLTVAAFAARVLRPRFGVLDGVLHRERNGWLYRLKLPVTFSIVVLPLSLAVTAALGYYYTTLQLERRLVTMYWLVLALIVFNGLVLRWLMIARRRLAIDEARKRRAAQGDEAAGPTLTTADGTLVIDEPKIDLNAINDQTRRLLRSAIMFGMLLGTWLIWIDMLPALGVLKRIEIYPHFGTISANETASTPGSATAIASAQTTPLGDVSIDRLNPTPPNEIATPDHVVTLSHLFMATLIIIMTIIVSKNIPGLLEITLLKHLPLEPSGRYAVSTLARYVLSIFGVIFAFHAVGIGWTQVQWLAAAITLGVGFGLQEIFANFISGIILLFEQPIRVGDTVTVNGMEGTVTRIRMRATTLTDYDRKEIIIPNKTFITGQIINWTLTDTIHRLVFNIGVAYGSDTALVENTLLQVAKGNALIMNEPAAHVVFGKFGESSLDFSLRVFIPDLEHVLRVRHEINLAIEQAFRKAGIEIAFPQRDVHIRTVPTDLARLTKHPVITRD